MNLNMKDYKTIREFALQLFNDKRVNYHAPDNFLCECYCQAFLHFLSSKGLAILPIDVLKK